MTKEDRNDWLVFDDEDGDEVEFQFSPEADHVYVCAESPGTMIRVEDAKLLHERLGKWLEEHDGRN